MSKRPKRQLTKNQAQYEKELQRLKGRIYRWKKTHRILYTDIPERPQKIYQKDIDKLRNIRWKSFTEEQKREYRSNYEEAYEENNLPNPYEYDDDFTPYSEDDFFNGNDTSDEDFWEDTDNEPAQSKEEIEAFIEETMDAILDVNGIERYNDDVRNIMKTLLDNLRFSLGDKGFYEFLSDPKNVEELTEAAQTGMATSARRDRNGAENPVAQDAIMKFVNVLNNHRPLDIHQAEGLEDIITSAGAFGDISFEDFE